MQCTTCGFDSPLLMKFCGRCGSPLAKECPTCGQLSPLDFQFCGHCGTAFDSVPSEAASPTVLPALAEAEATEPSAPSPAVGLNGERRQATVLIADVKGSTQVLELIGSEEWVKVMNQVLQTMGAAIYRFGGKVDQFRGDGLVAFFGASVAHEDDPERAVLAGLTMQKEIQDLAVQLSKSHDIDLQIRVGINTGEVITASIGDRAQHSEDTTMGGAVALAARLEAAAEPGTVLVGENTFRLVESLFKWEDLGEIEIRGLSSPVSVHRPLKPLQEAEQRQRLQTHRLWIPMIGRDEELDHIEAAIGSLKEGIGNIVLVSGEAGMGKSRLISEARQRWERDEAIHGEESTRLTWLQGRCRSYGQSMPVSMWVDMWHSWLGTGRWASPEEARERLRAQARQFWGDEFEPYYVYLAAFLSLPLEPHHAAQISQLDSSGQQQQFFFATRSWLEKMSQHEPLVIVFSEVHWADGASLDLLKFCLPLCLQERVLFLVVFRPDRTKPVWNFNHFVETEYFHRLISLDLQPLSEDQSRHLIRKMVGAQALSEDAKAQIIEKAGGNPYFLTEFINALVDRGVLVRDPDTGEWSTGDDRIPLDMPETLKSLLMARIDSLSPGERRTLQMAAVIGPLFWFSILESLAGKDHNLHTQLAAMQRAQLISERGRLPELGREYAFNSALIREAAYESVLSAQRTALHLATASALEHNVEEHQLRQYHGIVAYHYRHAGDCRKELVHMLLAAQAARQMQANQEAIEAYQLALRLLDEQEGCTPSEKPTERWQLEALNGLGQIQFRIGQVLDAEKSFQRAIELGRQLELPPHELARLFYWLGEVLFWQNRYEDTVQLGEEGLAMLGDQGESVERALMNQLVAVGSGPLGDHDKFLDFTMRTAGFLQRLPYSEELGPAYDHIIGLYGYTLKNIPETWRWLEVLRQKAEGHHDLRALGKYHEHSATLMFQKGDTTGAIHHHEKAIELFSQIGDAKHLSRAWKSLGVNRLQSGLIEEALACFDRALESAQVFANDVDYVTGYWYRGQALLCQSAWEDALESFEKASSLVINVPQLQREWALSGIGRVYLAQGMREEALSVYTEALTNVAGIIVRNPYLASEILSGLELCFDDPQEFRSLMDGFHLEHPEIHHATLKQWYLSATEVHDPEADLIHQESFTSSLEHGWLWTDPYEDCKHTIGRSLAIQAANERNLHLINHSAPRLLRQEMLHGDFTVQTVCQPVSKSRPGIGGLLVWLSEKYWFCLESGGRGADEITLRGFMNNHDLVFGRGSMRSKKAFLRLERRGHWLAAACSPDGEEWYSVGGCELSTGEGLRVGIHAIGYINRMVYPVAHPKGTAIRFDDFRLWQG